MWTYYPETDAAFASLSRGSERPILVVEGKYRPSDEQGAIFAEALNVHEQTGLTPAQLQARVAELEGALAARQVRYDLISEFARRENVSYNSLCALVREATGQ